MSTALAEHGFVMLVSMRSRGRLWGWSFLFALLVMASCGGGSDEAAGTFSCAAGFPSADGGFSPQICLELSGGTVKDEASNRQNCQAQGAMFATAPCPRSNLLGGCREQRGGLTITSWYYDDGSGGADDIRQLCTSVGATFVTS
jgi:hypothetical protein